MGAKPKWTPIKKALADLEKPELIQLLQGLFKLSDANRTFLASRFDPLAALDMLWKYRDKITEEFYPKRGLYGRFRASVIRKAISDYRRSTDDLSGTLELMITYIETGTTFMNEIGDIEELINSLCSMVREVAELLPTLEDQEKTEEFLKRLVVARDEAQGFGWGYGDVMDEVVTGLVDELEALPKDTQRRHPPPS